MNICRYDGGQAGRHDARDSARDSAALTSRQIAVLQCVREGLTNTETAARLGVSLNTIKWHLKGLSRALGAKNRCAVVHRAQLRGFI
jgi:DNA-binding NarL/FixJ family response regulator